MKTVLLSEVFHSGTMNSADKGVRGTSHEGPGLSVCQADAIDSWRSIARLGGRLVWKLTNPTSRLLDAHGCRHNKRMRQAICRWAEEQGLIKLAKVFEVTWYDDEWKCQFASTCTSLHEAKQEAEDRDGQVKPKRSYVLTRKLARRMGWRRENSLVMTWDGAVIAYAEAHGCDGVWWEDDHDLSRLSAPRGVIFKGKVPYWKVAKVHEERFEERLSTRTSLLTARY